jgi:hypothetical protein
MIYPLIAGLVAGRGDKGLALLRQDRLRHDSGSEVIFKMARGTLASAKALHQIYDSEAGDRERAQNLDQRKSVGRAALRSG